jgi:hypothetical protein
MKRRVKENNPFLNKANNGQSVQQESPEQAGGQMEQLAQQVQGMLEQGGNPEQVVAQLLQGQVPPEAIAQIFVSLGMSQEEVVPLIENVMGQMQGGQPSSNDGQSQQSEEEPQAFAYGGPARDEFKKYIKKEFGGDTEFSTKDTESHTTDVLKMFSRIVSRNNISAKMNDVFQNQSKGLPKADLGGVLKAYGMTHDEYLKADAKLKDEIDNVVANEGIQKGKRTYTKEDIKENKIVTNDGNNPNVFQKGYGNQQFYPGWNMYGQPQFNPYMFQNPNMNLSPFGQMRNAMGPRVIVRGQGSGQGLENAFLTQGLSGVDPISGKPYTVSQVEDITRNRLFRPDKVVGKRYHLDWGNNSNVESTPSESFDEQALYQQSENYKHLSSLNNEESLEPFGRQRPIADALMRTGNRTLGKIGARMYPDGPFINTPSDITEPSFTTPIINNEPTLPDVPLDTRRRFRKFDNGGDFVDARYRTGVNDWEQFGDGAMDALSRFRGFLSSMENKPNPDNYAVENIFGSASPSSGESGFYDQWGRFIPNDQGTSVLAGTGTNQNVYGQFDNRKFSGTEVFAHGGSYEMNQEFDLNPDEEAEMINQLKKAGYTLKKIG